MKLIEKKMNLFDLPSDYTLVHCISEDCAMGMGIAKTFDDKFKSMKNVLKETLSINDLKYPISIMYAEDDYKIINMITKKAYWHKPTYSNFLHALIDVVSICKKYNINKLAMPKIGCGLDKLSWKRVKEMIEEYFEDLDIEIIVCYI